MEFPIIKVRDEGTRGEGFFVGTDHHHKLILDYNGNIQFFNIQCNDGTGKDGSYEFITQEGFFGNEIQLVNITELLNIYKYTEGIHKHAEIRTRFDKVMLELSSILNDYEIIQDKEEKEMMGKVLDFVREAKLNQEVDNNFGELEAKRKQAKITTRDFANMVGVSPSRYCNLRENREKATEQEIQAMKAALDSLD
ncbi:MAG: hypothetical protein ACYCVD_19390 [Desulfitobacteriaceae bacterium]